MTISTGRAASDQAARAANDLSVNPARSGLGRASSDIGGSASSDRPWHRLDAGQLNEAFDRLIDKTVAAAASPAASDQLDLTFGSLGAIASFIHSARCHDGLMLQAGLALIAATHPDLTVLTRDVELPVTEAAQALIARNRPTELSGIRLAAEVFAREHYKADLVIVDEARRYAVVCDVKRSIASYNAAKLGRLKAKLLACAVVAPDHLRSRHQIDGVRTCHAAILDLSGHTDLSDPDVFGIDALDAFLRIDGAGAALRDLKRRFGAAVQAVLVDRLRAAYPAAMGSDRAETDSARSSTHAIHARTAAMDPGEDADRNVGSDDMDAHGTASKDVASAELPDGPSDARARRVLAMMPAISVALARPVAGTA
ncbi:MAG: hypothetical protein ACT6QU_09145 [Aliihoeflea sp.]|uniref:hypothetical protein n=1 Tax=Aliihoeflea sp. TaxID=2608088 RepID=UPI004033B7D9